MLKIYLLQTLSNLELLEIVEIILDFSVFFNEKDLFMVRFWEF